MSFENGKPYWVAQTSLDDDGTMSDDLRIQGESVFETFWQAAEMAERILDNETAWLDYPGITDVSGKPSHVGPCTVTIHRDYSDEGGDWELVATILRTANNSLHLVRYDELADKKEG